MPQNSEPQKTQPTKSQTLRRKYELEVDIANLSQEAHPPFFQYRSIVVASGIRLGKWYKEASKFLENDFHNKNLALFVSYMYEGGKPETYPAVVERLEKFSKEHLSVKPFAMAVFGGRMKFAGRVTADNRDANRINAWSESLGEKIHSQKFKT